MYFSTSISDQARTYIQSGVKKIPKYGFLLGTRRLSENLIFNIIFVAEPIDCDQLLEKAFSVEQLLPGNFSILGLAIFEENVDQSIGSDFINRFSSEWCQRKNLDCLSIISINFDQLTADRLDYQKSIGKSHRFNRDTKSIEKKLNEETLLWRKYSDMGSKLVTIRLRMTNRWTFNCQPTWNEDEIEHEIRRYFEHHLMNLFMNKSYFLGFRNGQKHLISMMNINEDEATRQTIGSISTDGTIMDLFGQISGMTKRKELILQQDIIDCFVMEKMTQSTTKHGNEDVENDFTIVPVVQYEAGDFFYCNIPLNFEIIAVCNQDEKLSNLSSIILEAYRRSVGLQLERFLKFSDLKKKRFCNLEPYVFMPSQCGHYVSDYFPVGFNDSQLESARRNLHTLLGLPIDRPIFKKSNRFYTQQERGPYLIDVHESVGESAISATMTGIVTGHYQYRHYMQDNFDDKNWGCAYRSFQTIWSWFLLNGYTDKPVPTHREIQQALVDVGDKQSNFVGSRQWVGSLELSYCLSHLAEVESRILSVTTGDEMGQKARELIHHFRTQGTPVMIGGGVLAHTILGVAYNEDSGESKFLVLDPHYTGDENIRTIVDKGWCDWKPVSFWDKNAFYNMMMPIRPNVF